MKPFEDNPPAGTRARWFLVGFGLLFIPGALWLAAAITTYPQESLAVAKRFGGFGFIALALAVWSVRFLRRAEKPQARSDEGRSVDD
jgi:hypothetical protein